MKVCTATLKSVSPYSQSRQHDTEKTDKEGHDDYEKRTWRNKLHTAADGRVFIPPMAFKEAVTAAAKFLGLKIPGKRNATWTKHFVAGVLVTDGLPLPVKADDVPGEWLNVNSDGVKGSGKRVKRCFPRIDQWGGPVTFYIADDTITKDVFEHHLREAGRFVGIGRFRPEKGGFYGRFEVASAEWSEA